MRAGAVTLQVNGQAHLLQVDAQASLMTVLRNDLRLNGPKYGCGLGECGACTVLVDGMTMRACLLLAVQANGRSVQTIEGVAAAGAPLHPIQAALSKHHGLQCGYCTPGVVMTLLELQRESAGATVTEPEIRRALSGNLCRCTGYQGMVDAALEVLNSPQS
jgi:carbon-monoxide dehydrogenase small subunit